MPRGIPLACAALLLGLCGCGKKDAFPARAESAVETPSAGEWSLAPAFPNLEFKRPLWMGQPDDGTKRWFLLEQDGRVRVFPDERGTAEAGVFLDLTGKVSRSGEEEGLLGMAFHPDYKSNGRFYLCYSAPSPRRSVLAQFKVSANDPNRADPRSERVLMEIPQPYSNHNGGCIVFGPDGMLYVSLGDGGAANDPLGHAQNLRSPLGAILRVDVNRTSKGREYGIPEDNPFPRTREALPEIWAWGLRNVWRMSFDRWTGELWAGDVGQNKWEEINIIKKGGNYGWNYREGAHDTGLHRFAPPEGTVFTDPIHEYGRQEGACITGGYVYRGGKFPELDGQYIYADYVLGTVWALRHEDGKMLENRVLIKQRLNVASFAEGLDGELYLLCFDGKVYELNKKK